MVTGVLGAAGSHNDLGVLNLSGLVEYLEDNLHPDHEMDGGLLPALYADAIFLNIIHNNHHAFQCCGKRGRAGDYSQA
jgi:hypothetical protein